MLISIIAGWSSIIGYNSYISSTPFQFHELGISREDGDLELVLSREVRENIVGGFYVTVMGNNRSCTAVKPHDLIEKRDGKFTTRFLERFDKGCLKGLKEGRHNIDVTYSIKKRFFTRRTETEITKDDINKAIRR